MFDVIAMSFELTLEEIAEIHILSNELDTELARQKIADNDSEYEKHLFDMAKKISAIRKKARERALNYYASHVNELITALQGEAKYLVFNMCRFEHDDRAPHSIDYWKKGAREAISIYSGLLSPEAQSDLLNFVDYVFTNREKIYRDTQKAIQRGQKGKTGYAKMLNGPGLNNGLRASKRRMKRSEKITATELEVIGEQVIDGTHIEQSNFDTLNTTESVRKLADILAIELTKQIPYLATAEQILKGRRVTLTLDEYMSICGLTDRKEARKQLRINTETLYNLSLEWDERSKVIDPETGRRKYRKKHWKGRYIDLTGEGAGITDSEITVYFTPEIAIYLSQAYITQINLQAFTIDTNKYRHAYSLFRKLYLHYYENRAKYKHIRISVESLLKACPDMPNPEEVSNRHYKQQIIDPLEANLFALRDEYGLIESWHYCNSGGEPLTDEQQVAYDFKDWLNWLVEYTLPADCPEPLKPKAHRRKKDSQPKAIPLPAKAQ